MSRARPSVSAQFVPPLWNLGRRFVPVNRRQAFAVAVGLLGFVALALYVPYRDVERVYKVVPVPHPGGLVGMGRTNEVREVNVRSAGYDWVWATPNSDRAAWFGTERETTVHWSRVLVQAAVWALLVVAGLVLLRGQAWPSR